MQGVSVLIKNKQSIVYWPNYISYFKYYLRRIHYNRKVSIIIIIVIIIRV